jgi:hypothetical protein
MCFLPDPNLLRTVLSQLCSLRPSSRSGQSYFQLVFVEQVSTAFFSSHSGFLNVNISSFSQCLQ